MNLEQKAFINAVRKKDIRYGNATKLPFKNETIDVVYSLHTIEHLYEEEFQKFLNEAERILKPGGVFRVAIPDLAICLKMYLETNDADKFCSTIYMGNREKPRIKQKISVLLFGDRKHKWMYDGKSMKKYIETHSNFDAIVLPAGETTIKGKMGINLREREGESVYLECHKRC